MLKFVGKFAGEGGFTRTLQTRHEDNCRFAFNVEWRLFATHQYCQLVVNDFYHQLAWVDRGDNVLAESLFLNGIGEVFSNIVVDIGVEQSAAHFLHGLCHVDFGNLAFAF